MIRTPDIHGFNHGIRHLRRAVSAGVILLAAWFAVSPLSADITAEISITDHGHPPKPEGAHITAFDFGDGGECVRATKVIGSVTFHIKAPITIKTIVEETPPELISDVMGQGIILAGGGSLIRGIDKLFANQTSIPVRLMEDPLTAVVRGTGIVLDDMDRLHEVLIDSDPAGALR